ncbi:HAD family hydrolase [Streptomyces sp. NPDC058092]|uniref:HAD family hydrolase n=1 Tax=Streptomyces sp. NPDC058092 TaxID=3346336 RepID=UPI0036EA630E
MQIKGVLFDFSGTLFRIESVQSWLRAVLAEREVAVSEADFERYARGLEAAGALPGGPPPRHVPARLADLWATPALIDAYVLSYEHGVQKPNTRLFHMACTLLGQNPADVVMVGDERRADGGAAALGCDVRFVHHLPVEQRPDGLRTLGLVPGVA